MVDWFLIFFFVNDFDFLFGLIRSELEKLFSRLFKVLLRGKKEKEGEGMGGDEVQFWF